MSSADSGDDLPEAIVYAPDIDTVHKPSDSGLVPACDDRLHNCDADWRLATAARADGERCRHPECFGGRDD
ncbi:hypothetical protein [Haloarcula sp. JP-L23]|uniref:hypothetical protein n=1 Tax=Haloarcula sp. JP-L23 TaxID=2716717 RepID=UPI00140EA136|nr:hypothetical protein G9465_12190 [Haloarcula sp. JP-L23]